MLVNPGELNKKITIFEYIDTQDSEGYPTKSKQTILNTYASFKRNSGTETVKLNADFGTEKSRFLIRYTNKMITRKMFIEYNGNIYDIDYINDYGDSNEYVEIWCNRNEVG